MKTKYLLVLFLYYLVVVLPHKQVGALIASVFLPGSRIRYNGVMLGFLCLLLLGIGAWLWRSARSEDKQLLSIYSLVTIGLITACINVLFVLNVEAIHFIQYAVFAIICFQLTASYFQTMFWSLLAGALDELYQYIFLAPKWADYYDFNDILINGVGAGIGLIIIRTLRSTSSHFSWTAFGKSKELFTIVLLTLMLVIGFLTGFLSYGPDPSASFCFIEIEGIDFWHIIPPQIKFHVVKPLEGLFFVLVIVLFYSGLQRGSVDISERSANN